MCCGKLINTYNRKEETLIYYWILLVSSLPNPKHQTSKEVALNSITKVLPAANRKAPLFSYIIFLEKERKYSISVSAGAESSSAPRTVMTWLSFMAGFPLNYQVKFNMSILILQVPLGPGSRVHQKRLPNAPREPCFSVTAQFQP